MTQLTSKQLRQAATIKDRIESLQSKLDRLLGGVAGNKAPKSAPRRRKMSAAARAKISAAAKARWAKFRAKKKG